MSNIVRTSRRNPMTFWHVMFRRVSCWKFSTTVFDCSKFPGLWNWNWEKFKFVNTMFFFRGWNSSLILHVSGPFLDVLEIDFLHHQSVSLLVAMFTVFEIVIQMLISPRRLVSAWFFSEGLEIFCTHASLFHSLFRCWRCLKLWSPMLISPKRAKITVRLDIVHFIWAAQGKKFILRSERKSHLKSALSQLLMIFSERTVVAT